MSFLLSLNIYSGEILSENFHSYFSFVNYEMHPVTNFRRAELLRIHHSLRTYDCGCSRYGRRTPLNVVVEDLEIVINITWEFSREI